MKTEIKERLINAGVLAAPVNEKENVMSNAAAVPVPVEEAKRKTITNWKVLTELGLNPTYVQCDSDGVAYNDGCHTTVIPKAEAMIGHLDNGHGGGFLISFRNGYTEDRIGANLGTDVVRNAGKPWKGWQAFDEAGIELRDLHCAVCAQQIALNGRNILRHLKPHKRGTRMIAGGEFYMTISRDVAQEDFEDEE